MPGTSGVYGNVGLGVGVGVGLIMCACGKASTLSNLAGRPAAIDNREPPRRPLAPGPRATAAPRIGCSQSQRRIRFRADNNSLDARSPPA